MQRTLIASLLLLVGPTFTPMRLQAAIIQLSMRTDNGDKLDFGFFGGGTLVQIGVSGVGSIREDNFLTNPDGSLFDLSGSSLGFFPYALSGASGYPSFNVGDGINHFVGGGLNLSTFNPAFYGFAGKQTTDTLDTLAIRFALVNATHHRKNKSRPNVGPTCPSQAARYSQRAWRRAAAVGRLAKELGNRLNCKKPAARQSTAGWH